MDKSEIAEQGVCPTNFEAISLLVTKCLNDKLEMLVTFNIKVNFAGCPQHLNSVTNVTLAMLFNCHQL